MFTLLLWLFLLFAAGLLFLIKTHPFLRPAAFALPVLALLLFVFRPSPSALAVPAGSRLQSEVAVITGEQLARALLPHLSGQGPVLILHPESPSHTFRQLRVQQMLEGISRGLAPASPRIVFYPLADAVYVELPGLQEALRANPGAQGIILIGLQIGTEEDIRSADLPPMVLSDLGDPGSSEWALQQGLAVAALFEKDIGSLPPGKFTPETYFSTRVELRISADFK